MARLHVSRVKGSEERSLIFSKAKAPQPDRDVHFGAPNSGLQHIIVRSGQSVQEVPDGWFSASISVGVKTVPRSTILEGRVGLECTYGSDNSSPARTARSRRPRELEGSRNK
jgi:hypothetical protein